MNRGAPENLRLGIIIAILFFLNVILTGFVWRWDLTSEKRYSLTDVSLKTARAIESPLMVNVFLEGELPPVIRNYQDAVQTTLIELKQYSRAYINYNFVDISNNSEMQAELQKRGFVPVPVRIRNSATEESRKLIWPIIHIRYREREQFVDLFEGAIYPDRSVNFEKAEAELEYKIVSTIRNVIREDRGLVVMLQGHGELQREEIPSDFGREIQNSYNLALFDMKASSGLAISPSVNVLMVLQPQEQFSERDKYELDQYLMRGGSILWVLDLQEVDLDLYEKRATLTRLRDLNLDDMFMKYGFKINYDLIQDLESEKTEVFIPGASGGSFDTKSWIYFPLIYRFPVHPISRNAELALLRYSSSLDTFFQPGIHKKVFMQTSDQSRVLEGTLAIDLAEVMSQPPPPAVFRNKGPYITGLSIEGIFESLFIGRDRSNILLDSLATSLPSAQFLPSNSSKAAGKMVVISDGDFVRAKEFRGKPSQYLPYDNTTILMNAIDYLAGDEALTQIRSKEIIVRKLDRDKALSYASLLRGINVVLPIVLIMFFGWMRFIWRKRKYAQI